MSRTYRAAKLPLDCNCGALIGWTWRYTTPTEEETTREINQARRKGVVPDRCCRCKHGNRKYDYYSKRNHKRDNKPNQKSPRSEKKVYGRSRKAKIKQAVIHGDYNNIPIFKRTNDWDRYRDYY